jgi:hypothetical protein
MVQYEVHAQKLLIVWESFSVYEFTSRAGADCERTQ